MNVNDLGTGIAVAAALLFYLRLIILQRNRGKVHQNIKVSKDKKKASTSHNPEWYPSEIVISSWSLMIAGILIILSGAVLAMSGSMNQAVRSYWWLPVTLGMIMMSLAIR